MVDLRDIIEGLFQVENVLELDADHFDCIEFLFLLVPVFIYNPTSSLPNFVM